VGFGAEVYREYDPVWAQKEGGTMDFVSSIKRNMTTAAYAQFDGRASRSEYWWFYLFTLLAGLAAEIVGSTVGNLATLVFFLPSLALAVRRLHDVGRSGWWVLILFTVIGIPVLLYWLVKDSDKGKNAYGEGPARA
jgi:uncharacterized membrane protein YhaH (DUF805 family)